MPIKSSSNNQIMPANARASDVAAKTIKELINVQQTRNMSAMRVQGYQGILYTRLISGVKCTCQASSKALNTRLNENGKASEGTINKLLLGEMSFDVTPYGARSTPVENVTENVTSPQAPVNKNQGVFDIVSSDANTYSSARIEEYGSAFGDNGPLELDFDLDSLAGDYDAAHLGFTDTTCAICFGSGFVGGYTPFNTYRKIYTANDFAVTLVESVLDPTTKPWHAESPSFQASVLFPRGVCGVDSFKVWNNKKCLAANFTVDGFAIQHTGNLLSYCDGRPHLVTATFKEPTKWTHLEVQFAVSSDSPYFEFPKLTQSQSAELLDKTDPFQIILGPNVPAIKGEDIIVDSTYGKALIVQSVSNWNTRERNNLGWDCNVRVAQPQEIFKILPKRGRVLTKSLTTNTSHPNKPGNRT